MLKRPHMWVCGSSLRVPHIGGNDSELWRGVWIAFSENNVHDDGSHGLWRQRFQKRLQPANRPWIVSAVQHEFRAHGSRRRINPGRWALCVAGRCAIPQGTPPTRRRKETPVWKMPPFPKTDVQSFPDQWPTPSPLSQSSSTPRPVNWWLAGCWPGLYGSFLGGLRRTEREYEVRDCGLVVGCEGFGAG